MKALADELGIQSQILGRRRRPSLGLAVALWRLTSVPASSPLSPRGESPTEPAA
jgi:hypothetical protein